MKTQLSITRSKYIYLINIGPFILFGSLKYIVFIHSYLPSDMNESNFCFCVMQLLPALLPIQLQSQVQSDIVQP